MWSSEHCSDVQHADMHECQMWTSEHCSDVHIIAYQNYKLISVFCI